MTTKRGDTSKDLSLQELRARLRELERQNGELHNSLHALEQDYHNQTERLLLEEHALNHAHEEFLVVSEDFRILNVNDEVCRALGYSREELYGMMLMDIEAHYSLQELNVLREKTQSMDGPIRHEAVHRRRDGSTFPVEILSSEFEYRGKKMGVSLARDISERKAAEEALRASDERLCLFFERQSVGMAITSPEKGWLRVNQKICDMLGYTAEELSKLTWADVTHPEDLSLDVDQFECMLKGEIDSYTVEKRYVRKGGGIVHAALSIGCVRRPDGALDYALALIEDVTERKRMEDELRQREKEARTLIEHSPDTIARYDRNSRRTFVNQAFAATVAGGAAALLGKTPSECPDGPNAGIYEEKIEGVLASGKADEFELVWEIGESEICSHIRLIPEFDAAGNVESVLAVGRDISDRKRYEAELRQTKNMLKERNEELQAYKEQLEQRVEEQTSELRTEIAERKQAEERLSAVAENVPGFIFTIRMEPDGRTSFPFASPGVEELFGVSPADIREDAGILRARYHPDDLPRVLALMEETERTLGLFRIEIRIANRDNRYVWIEIRSMPRRQPDGATEWHGIMLDISARKEAERELEASRAQLRREVARRDAMREEERKRLAREVHDELGQILTGLKLHVSNLDRICAMEANPLCEHVREIAELTDQAMGVARNISVVLRPVEAEMGIVSALELQANRFSTLTGIRCECLLPDDALMLNERCTTALYRIVQELLTNVARHANADEVKIAMCREGDQYVARVRDNGTGFDPAAIKRDSFGLAGIRERVSTLGGTMDIDSHVGRGTEVVVRIPAEVCHD